MKMAKSVFLFFPLLIFCQGAFYTPNGFTLTEVLSVHGSDANAGCPSTCVRMISSVRVCNCVGVTTDITGITLIDGVIPMLDVSQTNWAAQLYTAKATQNNWIIDFQFPSSSMLRWVDLYLLFCQRLMILGQGILSIRVYQSLLFPQGIKGLLLGNVTLTVEGQSCDNLTQVSIPINPLSVYTQYLIEFSMENILGGIYIGEVTFSDETATISTPSSTPLATAITNAATMMSPTAISPTSPRNSTIETLSSTNSAAPPISMSEPTSSVTNQGIITSASTDQDDTTSGVGSTLPTSDFPVVIVSVLVGVIVLLLVLVLVGCLVLGMFLSRRKNSDREVVQKLQGVVLECNSTGEPSKSDLSKNNALYYERTVVPGPRIASPTSATSTNYSESTLSENHTNSKIAKPVSKEKSSNSYYDDISLKEYGPGEYAVIDISGKNTDNKNKDVIDKDVQKDKITTVVESTAEPEPGKVRLLYSHVQKEAPPQIPQKTPELYRALKDEAEVRNSGNYSAAVGDSNDKEKSLSYCNSNASELEAPYYSSAEYVDKNSEFSHAYNVVEGDVSSEEVYSEVTEKQRSVTRVSTLTKSLNSSTSRNNEAIHHHNNKTNDFNSPPVAEDIYTDPDDVIYTNPNADDGSESVYDIIQESLEPSMFVKAEGTKEFEGEDIYAPAYDLSTLNSTSPNAILSLQPDNIKKVKTIGTGYFGKVYLADTVNLSHKDLRLGDNEDKTKSIRVAVKQLKSDPSSQAIEAFEKELKFMSRLDHENVIRVLGSCKGETAFIIMEYMENGDLNQYLVNFDNIVQETEDTGDFSIHACTLTKMAEQIANGMKYLSSLNFIHRDLATRNCLVGKDMRVKIADFGMSRNLYQSHYYVLKGHAVLPVRWMAKECFYGKFSTKTDVWAFGVTMWEIFTLAKDIPYEDMEDEELIADATRKDKGRTLLAKPTNCPANVYDVMLTCWKEQAKDRPGFDTLQQTLDALCSEDTTTEQCHT